MIIVGVGLKNKKLKKISIYNQSMNVIIVSNFSTRILELERMQRRDLSPQTGLDYETRSYGMGGADGAEQLALYVNSVAGSRLLHEFELLPGGHRL
jgi:hypothetical protein